MSKVDVLLGLQWGDEGKGKIVDFLAPRYKVVARFQGGPNAGHTLEFDGKKHVLHQIPSGIFREGITNVIGNGVVLDPIVFAKEINDLIPFGIEPRDSLILSNKAQIILPTHKLLDQAYEKEKGDLKIGSTLRGIGPTYQDKIGRHGLRVGDIISKDFDKKYEELKTKHLQVLDNYEIDIDFASLESDFHHSLEIMREFQISNTEYLLNEHLQNGNDILAEGAQGTLLDVDFGSYPYVTSSSTTAAGACTGLGIAPNKIRKVFGVFKAYCTRVGSGPFPTELHGPSGEDLRKAGHEFGATTGRPRRCGWLDLPALRYACMLNGVTDLYMMKADVLSGLSEIGVCHSYQQDAVESVEFPIEFTESIEPNLNYLSGWEINKIPIFSELPNNLSSFIQQVEEFTKVEVSLVSLGPDRSETVLKKR